MKTQTIVQVIGRRWFEKTNGNTYHSTEVIITDLDTGEKKSFKEPFLYGYGDQYRQTATNILVEHTNIMNKVSEENRRFGLTYWGVLDELKEQGVDVSFSVSDVGRKKDL